MISCVSKAFFIPADPLSPFLSFFVITNFGKSQSTHAAAPACGGQRLRRGAVAGHDAPAGYPGPHPAQTRRCWDGEELLSRLPAYGAPWGPTCICWGPRGEKRTFSSILQWRQSSPGFKAPSPRSED